ncbi:MAG TPA: nitroreductase family deazaflavin-dependent oxidoreductase [Actinomycetota bacterium]
MTEDPSLGSQPFCYLTTRGRVTGASHRIEIWFALHDGVVYVLSGGRDRADWVRNVLVSPDVVVEIGDANRSTRARVVEPGTDEDALARRLLLEKYGVGGNLTEWARTSLPVAIEWRSTP